MVELEHDIGGQRAGAVLVGRDGAPLVADTLVAIKAALREMGIVCGHYRLVPYDRHAGY